MTNEDLSTHPSTNDLAAFAFGTLDREPAEWIAQHLEDCGDCSKTIARLQDDTFVSRLRSRSKRVSPTVDPAIPSHGQPARRESSSDGLPAELRDHPRYDIRHLIGRGGMGDVYAAQHRVMSRTVALKVIKPELVRSDTAVERFRREVQAAARLRHPNIVTAHDAEQAGDLHYLVMEYVDGTDLDEIIRRDGPLPIATACDYIRQAAEGLQHAHEMGMVHRDIKPHNLMVGRQAGTPTGSAEVVKILDFGLAGFARDWQAETVGDDGPADTVDQADVFGQLTLAGAMMGTPDYIAPEQTRDAHSADIRADVYSLGCTFFTLLTGQAPFGGPTVADKIEPHRQNQPPDVASIRPEVPADVAAIVRTMMAKEPNQRFQTPAEVAAAIAGACQSAAVPRRQLQPAGSRRRPRVARTLLIAALFFVAGVGVVVMTDRGRLEIQSEADDIQVVVSKNGQEVRTLDVRTGSQVAWLPGGEYELKLAGRANNVVLDEHGFELSRFGKVVVTARVTPPDSSVPGARLEPGGLDPPAPMLTEILRLDSLDDYVLSVAFSPNGQELVTGSGNPSARVALWDARNGRRMAVFDGHRSSVHRVEFSPDGSLIASAGKGEGIVLLDSETLQEQHRLHGHTGVICELAISPDGRYLATGSTNWDRPRGDVSVRVWDLKTKQQLWTEDLPLEQDSKGQVHGVAFSPDGARLVTVRLGGPGHDRVTIWETATGRSVRSFGREGSGAKSVAWSPDGRWIAVGHRAVYVDANQWQDAENCVIRLFDAATGEEVRQLRGHTAAIDTLAFSPDSRLLASGSGGQYLNDKFYEKGGADNSVRLWDVASGRQVLRHNLDKAVKCVRFSPDGRRLVTSAGAVGEAPDVVLWRTPNFTE